MRWEQNKKMVFEKRGGAREGMRQCMEGRRKNFERIENRNERIEDGGE
jgi:hypothetical protein